MWNRWWFRLVVMWITAACVFPVAIGLKIALVTSGLVQDWLDSGAFVSRAALVTGSLSAGLIFLPFFAMAEAWAYLRHKPLPWQVYTLFVFSFLMIAILPSSAGNPVADLFPGMGEIMAMTLYVVLRVSAAAVLTACLYWGGKTAFANGRS